jgi:predicted NUDIX family phosphoesterase
MDSNISSKERKDMIVRLQKQAEAVLELKNIHRQKRPIVIEFSGSPKSGKTSCINSLGFFLKRNGFNVEIVHERANVCPVANKKSPMFNIWTICASIMGMLSVLEKKENTCDVLILDRGIFDAFCWFDWLTATKKMEDAQKKVIENFLTMDLIVNRIDIVFAFTASPEISIQREYAYLLTDKPGTIMNKNSLAEYLSSIKRVLNEKKQFFHKIIKIDSSTKDQDEVGKEVTEKTLDELKSMLMERIGYVKLSSSSVNKLKQKRFFQIKETHLKNFFGNINFELRDIVEGSMVWQQPVPIAVITDSKRSKVLAVRKRDKAVSSDSPEKDKILLYVGGHTRTEDFTDVKSDDFLSICRYSLRREIDEELGICFAIDNIIPSIIYTPNTPKSKKHIGICFLIECNTNDLKFQIDANELILNKGKSKSGHFHDVKELVYKDSEYFESWSIEIVKNCFGIDIEPKVNQKTLFDEE